MEPPGLSSAYGSNREFKSWPDYCKKHRFISSLSGLLPDMILPRHFKDLFVEVTDNRVNRIKGQEYRKESGMAKMSQTRPNYGKNLRTFEGDIQESEEDDILDSEHQPRTVIDDDGGETMESDCDQPTQSKTGLNVIEGKRRKDKTIKCKKCLKGGHEDVHCIVKVVEKFCCHICEEAEADHDTLYCPYIDNKCRICYQTGHSAEMCKLGALQVTVAKIKPWRQL